MLCAPGAEAAEAAARKRSLEIPSWAKRHLLPVRALGSPSPGQNQSLLLSPDSDSARLQELLAGSCSLKNCCPGCRQTRSWLACCEQRLGPLARRRGLPSRRSFLSLSLELLQARRISIHETFRTSKSSPSPNFSLPHANSFVNRYCMQ